MQKNNFDFLRLLAALMVIYGHGMDMKGIYPLIVWNTQISGLGLDVFFCISGYLVTESWERQPQLGAFLLKRALRIFPALIVAVIITAFVIGAIATTMPLGRYLQRSSTFRYLYNIGLYLELYLPGVFQDRRLGGAVNGSLWSLFPEALCYLTVPLLGLVRQPVARLVVVTAAGLGFGLLGLHLFDIGWGKLVYSLDVKYFLVQTPFFFAGSLLRLIQGRVPDLFRADLAIMCCGLSYGWTWLPAPWAAVLQWVTLAYIILCFGRMSSPLLRHAARFGDLSYGMYLYAFPVQQLILEEHGPAFAIILCTIVSAGLAFLSWHLVERPALRLKPRARLGPATSSRDRDPAATSAATLG